ncbi:hypothetical protein QEH59_07825 [Coraliomargarita sp. SDUM461004]|uniref:PEP-CTERM sorting domain-containing protein n=1 Tax=Thalassobacterium sedimentorum TaxID=3041258 RepID=A0ABU1AI81_9BACT|nr:hypothetical protein [Coraliomargarita sp. SDUM461004]MDQ8194329.1 hypothetical protein [Coraliomargarita sp. SDUM461004]
MKTVYSRALLLSLPLLFSSVQADVLLSEDFDSGERNTQDLPDTSAWYSSASGGLNDTSGDLVSTANRFALTYFTDSGTVDLAVGDSLTVDFSFSVSGPTANYTNLRVGLLDSGGSRITGDLNSLSDAAFEDYSGYAAFMNVNQSSGFKLSERLDGYQQLIHSGSAYSSLTESSLGTGGTYDEETTYNGVFSVTRTSTGVDLYFSIDNFEGYSATVSDNVGATISFDTFVFYGADTAVSGYSLSSVEVSYSAVPEFSSSSVVLGLAGAVAAVASRRRR